MSAVLNAPKVETKKGMKDYVADLSADEISEMANDELVYAIRAISEHFGMDQRIDSLDRENLIKMTLLARRCCRSEGHGDTAAHD